MRQNKYDLAHQFANVIKQMFVYIKNRTGDGAKLRFNANKLAVRFVSCQYVSYRDSTFRTRVTVVPLKLLLSLQMEQDRGRFLKVKISQPPWVNNNERCLQIDDLVSSEKCRVRPVLTP